MNQICQNYCLNWFSLFALRFTAFGSTWSLLAHFFGSFLARKPVSQEAFCACLRCFLINYFMQCIGVNVITGWHFDNMYRWQNLTIWINGICDKWNLQKFWVGWFQVCRRINSLLQMTMRNVYNISLLAQDFCDASFCSGHAWWEFSNLRDVSACTLDTWSCLCVLQHTALKIALVSSFVLQLWNWTRKLKIRIL